MARYGATPVGAVSNRAGNQLLPQKATLKLVVDAVFTFSLRRVRPSTAGFGIPEVLPF